MKDPLVASRTSKVMAEAASGLLPSLSSEQREQATFDFSSDERLTWHYTPVPRKGIARGELDGAQIEAADALMASGLSEEGFRKARAIIRHELVLAGVEDRKGINRFDRTPDLYFYSVFGVPGGDEPWGYRVEGHHLSLHYTIVNRDILSPTPCFFGANPAEVQQGPHTGLRVLKEEEDLARELLSSLAGDQRERAVIYPAAPADLITRAGRRVEISERKGLPAEKMSADQRELLTSLIRVYVDRQPAEVAANSFRKIETEGVENIFFGWAGSEHRGQGHYYRVQGPSLFIEYDNTQDGANHIHSVLRDIQDDFGFDLLLSHYKQHHEGS